MSLNFEHSDIFLDTLLHSREQLKSENPETLPSSVTGPRRRRTKSTAFESEPNKGLKKGFLGEWRSKSYGQDVAKLPETLIRHRVARCQICYTDQTF